MKSVLERVLSKSAWNQFLYDKQNRGLPDKKEIEQIRIYIEENGRDFTWSRWFFPYLSVDTGLKEIDRYMQEYIRYCVTGRHYKGNYRISYEQMKKWGYLSLVHEYYRFRKEKSCG